MARTKDPHAATVKSWETRRRAGPTQVSGDWKVKRANAVTAEGRLSEAQRDENFRRIARELTDISRAANDHGMTMRYVESYWENYSEVNRLLRDGTPPRDPKTEITYDSVGNRYLVPPLVTKEKMDAIFAHHAKSTTKEEIVFRGDGHARDFESISVGDEIEDKGWVSTSLDPSIAISYAEQKRIGRSEKQVIFRIKVPRGTKYLPGHWGHQELIFKRGSRFKVNFVGRDNLGRLAVDLEVMQ